MERGYLVAVLAIVATFTAFSHGFRSVEQWSLVHIRHFSGGGVARSECPAKQAARAMAKIRTHLRPRYAEEAQLLAEMNVPIPEVNVVSIPIPEMPSDVFEDVAGRDAAAAQCARERAMRDAERTRREMVRMQREIQRATEAAQTQAMAIRIHVPENLDQQIQQRIQERIQAQIQAHAAEAMKSYTSPTN